MYYGESWQSSQTKRRNRQNHMKTKNTVERGRSVLQILSPPRREVRHCGTAHGQEMTLVFPYTTMNYEWSGKIREYMSRYARLNRGRERNRRVGNGVSQSGAGTWPLDGCMAASGV